MMTVQNISNRECSYTGRRGNEEAQGKHASTACDFINAFEWHPPGYIFILFDQKLVVQGKLRKPVFHFSSSIIWENKSQWGCDWPLCTPFTALISIWVPTTLPSVPSQWTSKPKSSFQEHFNQLFSCFPFLFMVCGNSPVTLNPK